MNTTDNQKLFDLSDLSDLSEEVRKELTFDDNDYYWLSAEEYEDYEEEDEL